MGSEIVFAGMNATFIPVGGLKATWEEGEWKEFAVVVEAISYK